jgi:diadenylate cyclase
MIESALPFRVLDIVDLLIVWGLVWAGIAWLRTTPARLALAGLAIFAVFYLLARQLGLVLTTWLLQGFAAVSVLIGVVVFQQELRRLFERVATLWVPRRPRTEDIALVDVLARTLAQLVELRRGALIVIPGRDALESHVDGGIPLDARVSEPLLLSIFDPHSPGHDGAILLEGSRVARFAAHLPLSTDHAQLGQRGTRHAAALGLAERTDALCLVVSEERGSVSVARDGRLRLLPSPQSAALEMRRFLDQLAPNPTPRTLPRRLLARWREAAAALPVAAVLWVLAVPGSSVVEFEREVPVNVIGIPPGYALEAVEPTRVTVAMEGQLRDVFMLDSSRLQIRVDAILVELGRRTFVLTPENVVHPDSVDVRRLEPDSVKVSLRRIQPPEAG